MSTKAASLDDSTCLTFLELLKNMLRPAINARKPSTHGIDSFDARTIDQNDKIVLVFQFTFGSYSFEPWTLNFFRYDSRSIDACCRCILLIHLIEKLYLEEMKHVNGTIPTELMRLTNLCE